MLAYSIFVAQIATKKKIYVYMEARRRHLLGENTLFRATSTGIEPWLSGMRS
jgi:hypothetical protein